MDARDLFLEQHSAVHSAEVGGNKMSMAERAFGGLTDEQMRARPREDLNSLAWLMWHIARTEDVMFNLGIANRPQVADDGWVARLKTTRRDIGTGMTSREVSELTRGIDLGALRDYRDAVGRRTREIVGAFGPRDWEGEITADAMERAVAQDALGVRSEMLVKAFTGRPRRAILSGIGVLHSAGHIGEAGTVRTAGGFGTGV